MHQWAEGHEEETGHDKEHRTSAGYLSCYRLPRSLSGSHGLHSGHRKDPETGSNKGRRNGIHAQPDGQGIRDWTTGMLGSLTYQISRETNGSQTEQILRTAAEQGYHVLTPMAARLVPSTPLEDQAL